MNYYSHHIGDYLSATAHLTLLEHGAYRRMIDVYYIHESALPLDRKQVYRLVGARTKDEREAVDSVLEEFFTESEDGWVQSRCDHEISLCNKNRENGKKGGRPSGNGNPKKTQTKPNQEPKLNPNETQDESPPSPHHPITPSPKVSISEQPASTASEGVAREAADARAASMPAMLTKAMRQAGVDAQPADPRLIAIAAQGVTAETVASACDEAKRAKPGERIPVGYVVGIIERWAKDAGQVAASGAVAPLPRGSPRKSLSETRAETIAGLTGANRTKEPRNERDITAECKRLTA